MIILKDDQVARVGSSVAPLSYSYLSMTTGTFENCVLQTTQDNVVSHHDLDRLGDSKRGGDIPIIPMYRATDSRSSVPVLGPVPPGVSIPGPVPIDKLVEKALLNKLSQQLSEDDAAAVSGCVSSLFTTLRIFGLVTGPDHNRSFANTVTRWKACSVICGSWMKYVKWRTAAFFHEYSDNTDEAPPCPIDHPVIKENPRILCSGIAGRFAKVLATRDSKDREPFLSTIQQLKKGCPRPSTEDVAKGVTKAIDAITTTRGSKEPGFLIPMYVMKDSFETFSNYLSRPSVEMQLRRTVQELFRGHKFTDAHRFKPIFPSTKACVEASIKKGGAAMGEFALPRTVVSSGIMGEGKTQYTVDQLVSVSKSSTEQFRSGTWLDNFVKESGDIETKGDQRGHSVDVTGLEHVSEEMYYACVAQATEEISHVVAVGLAESLKIRVISKGRAALGKALHPLQKFMWSTLRKHKAFKLIGEPVTAKLLQSRLGATLAEDEYYLSGDYSAATDNLAPWVSDCIANAIADEAGLSSEERNLFLKSLTGNVFKVTDKEGNVSYKQQLWGQLMGSIVSFPVLCIANAALCRWACEVDKQNYMSLNSTSIMINGDDVVFKTTARGHVLWERITAFAGLETSIGKTYLSRSFAQINSVNFRRLSTPIMSQDGTSPRTLWFEPVPYINLGLMFGLKRSGESVGINDVADTDVSIGERARALISTCPGHLREPVMSAFLHHHRDVLDKCKVPWFMPESWGGIGLPTVIRDSDIPSDYQPGDVIVPKWGPTIHDRQLAARILEKPHSFPVSKPPKYVKWEVHKQVMSNLPAAEYGYPSKHEEQQFSKLYGAMCTALWFDAATKIDCDDVTIYEKDEDKQENAMLNMKQFSTNVLKQNQRSWQKANWSGKPPPPLSLSTIFTKGPPKPYLPINMIHDRYSLQSYENLTAYEDASKVPQDMNIQPGFERDDMLLYLENLW